jgi:hypothetical protein
MASNPVHGAGTGVAWHNKRHESFCVPCADYAADRGRAYGITSGKRKSVIVSASALSRILGGSAPADVLAAEFGPQTFAAVRDLEAGER